MPAAHNVSRPVEEWPLIRKAPESARERFHRVLFEAVQSLRGRPIGAYIRQLQQWERLKPDAFQVLRTMRLRQTLEYASEQVPFYRTGRWQAELGSHKGDLRAWPVLERQDIQAHVAELFSQPVPAGHYIRRTSGSTGSPLGVAMDADAAAWAWATDYRGLLWHGIPVGARSLSLTYQREGVLAEWIRGVKPLPTTDLSPGRLTEGVTYLQTAHPTYVSGYVSAVAELAKHARMILPDAKQPLVPYIKVLGEMLYPFQRQEIEQGLGGRVIETYGCRETGTVAYECPHGSLHVFSEHVEVEILRDHESVPPGETGDIVLTCTTNRVMPLIRYRVGDKGCLLPEPCACGRPHPVITGIEGRVGDLFYTAAGIRVHGAALGAVLKDLTAQTPLGATGRVLFEQHDRLTWNVLVQAGPGFNPAIAQLLAEGVQGIFGRECRVTVKAVREIPREPSGKFRFYRRVSDPAVATALPATSVGPSRLDDPKVH